MQKTKLSQVAQTPYFLGGGVTFSNGTESVSVDTSDLYNLRTAIEELETKYDTGIVTALAEIGTTIATEDPTFDELMTGIVNSQSVKDEHTAMIENNLSVGYAGWVNGTYVVGNGKDNDDAYNRGYADGLAKADSGTVQYVYHYHDSTCERTCRGIYTRKLANNLGDGKYTAYVTHHHYDCGKHDETYYWTVQGNAFNGQECNHTYYICGYVDGQVIGAEIVFD